jgi:iron complex transport system permease protein
MVQSVSTNQVKSTEIDRELVVKVSLDKLSEKLPFTYNSGLDYQDRRVLQSASLIADIRWPRVAMAVFVGAALAIAGAAIQGVFRNPLAAPGLVGISSGAAVGAVTAILLKTDFSDVLKTLPDIGLIDLSTLSGIRFAQTIFAFIGSLLATLLVYRLARSGGRTDTASLLLIGFAVNTIGGAYVGLATYIGDEAQTTDIIFWSLGSLTGINWQDVYLILPFVLVGSIILPLFARQFNVMTLGDAEAQHLGVNTERIRQLAMLLSAVMVGAAVSFAGIIGFIGLVIPHLMRLLFGPDHRIVLPSSLLGGAIFLVAADMIGRSLPGPSIESGITIEVPVGVLTALVGGPFFLFLILFTQRRRGR